MTDSEKFEFLKSFRGKYLAMEILRNQYLELLERWLEPAADTAKFSQVGGGGGGGTGNKSKIESSYIQLRKLEEKVFKMQDDYLDVLLTIETSIDRDLKEDHEKNIIRLRYIRGITWNEIANIVNYDIRHVFRIHASAVQKLHFHT